MRKNVLVALAALALLSLVVFAGCSKSEAKTAAPSAAAAPAPAAPAPAAPAAPAATTYQDGIYFAMGESFASSGWKETVTLTVSGGKIVEAVNAGNIAVERQEDLDKAGNTTCKFARPGRV